MPSNIEFITINEKYPIAGQDNNSQGFRDNFKQIKKGLRTANQEVTDLQNNTARTDVDSEFGIGTTQSNLNLKNFTQALATGEGLRNVPDDGETLHVIDYTEGQYFAFSVSADVAFSLANWPAENYASIIVELRAAYPGEGETSAGAPPYTVVFQSEGNTEIKKGPSAAWRKPYENDLVRARVGSSEIPESEDSAEDLKVEVFQFWTTNGGETVYAKHLGSFDVGSDPSAGGGQVNIDFLNDIGDVEAVQPNDGDLLIFKKGDPLATPITYDRWEATTDGIRFKGDIIGEDDEIMLNHNTRIFTGDLDGSVIGPDSSFIVDSLTGQLTGDLFGDVYGGLVIADYVNLNSFANSGARDTAIPSPTGGEIAFVANADSGSPELQGYDGSEWINMLGGGDAGLTVWERTSDFVISSSSVGIYYRIAWSSDVTVTVPPDADAAIPIGSTVTFIQADLGGVVIAAGTGVTINSADGFTKTRTQYSAMTITKVGANEWDLYGDLSGLGFICAVLWNDLGDEQYADKQVSIGSTAPDAFEPAIEVTRPLLAFSYFDPFLEQFFEQDGFIRDNPLGASLPESDWLFFALPSVEAPPAGTSPSSASTTTSGAELFVSGIYPGTEGTSYWTTVETFAPDSVVIYFTVSEATTLVAGDPDIVFTLNSRPADNFSNESLPVSVATQTVTVARSDVVTSDTAPGEEVINLVQFENPGWFNSFTVQMPYGAGVSIQDIRLCKDGELQVWPLMNEVSGAAPR